MKNLLLCLLMGVSVSVTDKEIPPSEKKRNDAVHPLLKAVHIERDGRYVGSGVLMVKRDDSPLGIFTVNHMFSILEPGLSRYSYKVLGSGKYVQTGHLAHVLIDERRVGNSVSDESIMDLAIAHVGKSSLISNVSRVRVFSSQQTVISGTIRMFESPIVIQSIATGETNHIVGSITTPAGVVNYISPYKSVAGESGSGFWDEKEKSLYILSVSVTEKIIEDQKNAEQVNLSVFQKIVLGDW